MARGTNMGSGPSCLQPCRGEWRRKLGAGLAVITAIAVLIGVARGERQAASDAPQTQPSLAGWDVKVNKKGELLVWSSQDKLLVQITRDAAGVEKIVIGSPNNPLHYQYLRRGDVGVPEAIYTGGKEGSPDQASWRDLKLDGKWDQRFEGPQAQYYIRAGEIWMKAEGKGPGHAVVGQDHYGFDTKTGEWELRPLTQ